jgi:FkbH-like protein
MNKLIAARRALQDGRTEEALALLGSCAQEAKRLVDVIQLDRFAAELALLNTDGLMARTRVAVLGDYTAQPFTIAVRCGLIAEGVIPSVYEGRFAAYRQEILDASSPLHTFKPDLVLIATGTVGLQSLPGGPIEPTAVAAAVDTELRSWQTLWRAIEQSQGVRVLQHLYETPEEDLVGPAERMLPWSPVRFVEALNHRLLEHTPGFLRWVDIDRLAARVGRREWHDPRLYYHGKFAMSMRMLPEYIIALRGAWRSAIGRTKKVLVVDLDNTLWGGVIGEDGLDGIRLGPGSAEGEAFVAFSQYLKALQCRGVILAACSKNNADTAREVFLAHAAMPLRLDDFAVFCCNWEDKASNLRAIARELNIDLWSFVFVDDNEAECELVRRELPGVTVVHLTGDPSQFRRQLDDLHLFDAAFLSAEDMVRAASYAGRRRAAQLQEQATDLESYLISLAMTGIVYSARPQDLPRLAQMELKTNQFNLTTRRYSIEDIKRLMEDRGAVVMALKLADRFAEHGLVGSLIGVLEPDAVRIDSWLMSCRVFSRTAEEYMLLRLIDYARARGVHRLRGEYLASPKNSVVADLYQRMGFRREGADLRWWQLDLDIDWAATHRCFITDYAATDSEFTRQP